MMTNRFNLIEGSLYRSPLRLTEAADPQIHHRSWDLGYHHAKRGKALEPDNPAIGDRDSYVAGYNQAKKETATQGSRSPDLGHSTRSENRPEQDIEPSMKLSLHDIPESVGRLATVINDAGGRALLIGGAVRDKLVGKTNKDYDIEVYGLHPDKLEELLGTLGKVDAVGKAFGVLKIVIGDDDFDVSVPRRESKVGAGHKGFIPVPDPSMTIKEAARRRDFTMNTVAMDPHTGEVFDPYGGVDDLKNKILKATDPTAFAEDPLRILRGAQFAARFGMTVDPETMQLMRQASPELTDLPRERVGTEWGKLLLKGAKPSSGLDVMKESGALQSLHPELAEISNTGEWDQTKSAVDRATEITKNDSPEVKESVRFAALVHSLPPQGVAGVLHDGMDVRKKLSTRIERLVGEHSNVHDEMSNADIRHMAYRLAPKKPGDPTHGSIEELSRLVTAIRGGQSGDNLRRRAEVLGVNMEPPRPLIGGRELMKLGIRGGPHMSGMIDGLYKQQLDGKITNAENATQAARDLANQQESLSLRLVKGGLYRTPLIS